ncbi:hypothetical protein OsJ_17743 [Oryza sativa Japonica Group]|uniref:Uncharacterized protein n=2 Tax=Oryza TaxID=4527 RepID=B9FJG2_ORYSJ|nr:hypothetical protein OsJ_17743 [Oryza sativa Japonica Group]
MNGMSKDTSSSYALNMASWDTIPAFEHCADRNCTPKIRCTGGTSEFRVAVIVLY